MMEIQIRYYDAYWNENINVKVVAIISDDHHKQMIHNSKQGSELNARLYNATPERSIYIRQTLPTIILSKAVTWKTIKSLFLAAEGWKNQPLRYS